MTDYAVLRQELLSDPLARGYSGMTDANAAISLNTVNRTLPRAIVNGTDIIRKTVIADYNALSAAGQAAYWGMVGCYGGLDPNDANTVAVFSLLFSGKTTLTNLATLQTTAVSRAGELGQPVLVTRDVTIARSGVW